MIRDKIRTYSGIAFAEESPDAPFMKTKHLFPWLAVVALLSLTACPETKVPRSFGSKPVHLKTDEWNGTWRSAGESEGMNFTVTNAAKGELTITFSDKDKKEEPLVAVVSEVASGEEAKDMAFLIHFEGNEKEVGPFNLIRRTEKGVFYLWGPKHDAIEAAVKSGELKGELIKVEKTKDEAEHNHTKLAADAMNYTKLLDPKFWEWNKPEAFVRSKK